LRSVYNKKLVGIETSYGLDDKGVEFRAPVRSRIFFSPRRPDRLFKCSSVTLVSIDNGSVTDAIPCNWHFYNDVNTPGG
jgi:hypothetical protein